MWQYFYEIVATLRNNTPKILQINSFFLSGLTVTAAFAFNPHFGTNDANVVDDNPVALVTVPSSV